MSAGSVPSEGPEEESGPASSQIVGDCPIALLFLDLYKHHSSLCLFISNSGHFNYNVLVFVSGFMWKESLKKKKGSPPGLLSQVVLVVKYLPASVGDARDVSSIPGLGISPEGGNGNPLQYSCLENSMDRRAWQATVLGS